MIEQIESLASLFYFYAYLIQATGLGFTGAPRHST
jgi:hypothetical protein